VNPYISGRPLADGRPYSLCLIIFIFTQTPNMKLEKVLPTLIDWNNIPSEQAQGKTGFTISKMQLMGDTKIRFVEYSVNYTADHWCAKGHIIFVLEGELEIQYQNAISHLVEKGMSYLVGDDSMAHMAVSKGGAKVLIID
jgi:hypothetical protein